MCGIMPKAPKPPKPPAQFQEARAPEYDARGRSTERESRRRGFASAILFAMSKGALAAPSTTAVKSTLGA